MTEEIRDIGNFEKLVNYAEEFIEINALKIINKLNGTEYKDCYNLIASKYHPLCRNLDGTKINGIKVDKKTILKRFCIQLQNYQRRPQTIDYISHSYNPEDKTDAPLDLYNDNNEIFEYMLKPEQSKDAKSIYEYFRKKDKFDEKENAKGVNLNHNWDLYAKGLAKVKELIQDESYIKTIQKLCTEIDKSAQELLENNSDDELKNHIKKFLKNKIPGMGEVLPYDFFKELYCLYLIKVDVHIISIYKQIYGNEDDKYTILINFIKLCLKLKRKPEYNKYTPYYIDKIFWLCCTGSFYEDGITIQKMTRRNFFKFIDAKIKNNI